MSNNDKYLKDMWKEAGNLNVSPAYKSETIERYISSRSNDTFYKIRNMIVFDTTVKVFVITVLILDFILYFGTTNVMLVTLAGIFILFWLIFYQSKLLKRFARVVDNRQNTLEKLSSMLTYLRTKFLSTLISISSTYLFLFIAGVLAYFYAEYGFVRTLDGIDIMVFMGFISMGIILNFMVNHGQVKHYLKHLEVCLSDLNESNLELVSENIELHRKQDRSNKILLALLLVLGFLLLIAVFMNIGAS